MKTTLLLFLLGISLLGCNSIPATAGPSIPQWTQTVSPPAVTMAVTRVPNPSPTSIRLPYNPDGGSGDECKPPYAVLPVSDGNDISENEIVYELVKIWLRGYKQTSMSPSCRIAGYSIDRIYDDPREYTEALQPRGDFMRVVNFSVKLIQIPTDWMAFPGELDQDNWLHISHVVAITKTSTGYQLEFAYP
ncbi:MAG: hypothetical protein ACM3PS_03910 [Syntrophothermus sp.]